MFAERRQLLLDQLGTDVMIVPAARPVIRNNDVEHDYRQSSDFFFLTGFEEPEALLLIGGCHSHRQVLFLKERDPDKERWDGARLGAERAPEALSVDAAFPIGELANRLPEYLSGATAVHVRLGENSKIDQLLLRTISNLRRGNRKGVVAPDRFVDLSVLLHEMRLVKTDREISLIRDAIKVTDEAHRAAMGLSAPGRYEYEVEAELMRVFRANGSSRAAYGSIVGSGNNATVLHYRSNNRRMEDGDLLLIDAGCELNYYASDVTRTFPINGKFTGPQREVYEVVLASQHAACAAVKPGATLPEVHQAALEVIVDGLIELELVTGSRDAVLEEKTYTPFFMHRTSHWLGMDVHDVGAYTTAGEPRVLEPNMVLTVEPGIYVPDDAVDVPDAFRSIGVRIEDDLAVTAAGHENLSASIPKSIDDVEAAVMAGS